MQDNIPASFERIRKTAAPMCVLALVALLSSAIFFHSLYPIALIMSPLIGLLAFAADFLHWRTRKNCLNNWSGIILIGVVGVVGYGPLLLTVPQTLAIAILFWLGPVIIFNKQLAAIAYARHS